MNRNPFGGIGLAMGFSGESLVTRSKDVFKFERKATAVVFWKISVRAKHLDLNWVEMLNDIQIQECIRSILSQTEAQYEMKKLVCVETIWSIQFWTHDFVFISYKVFRRTHAGVGAVAIVRV